MRRNEYLIGEVVLKIHKCGLCVSPVVSENLDVHRVYFHQSCVDAILNLQKGTKKVQTELGFIQSNMWSPDNEVYIVP